MKISNIIVIIFILLIGGWYMMRMPFVSYQGPFLPLSQHEMTLKTALQKHVEFLAGKLGERNIWQQKNLDAAANYISNQFKNAGFAISEQTYTVNKLSVKNIIAEKRGTIRPKEILIIGAHYDTVLDSPGADDNASGVAAILALANFFKTHQFPCTVRFIAFVNEESPFYFSKKMGSWQYASAAKKQQENIIGMLSIESIGYYSSSPHTQHYPFLLSLFYPNTADFIGFVSNFSSRNLLHKIIGSFRQHAKFPSEGIAAPSIIPGVSWSDHWSFWKHGYQAVMVTDTALYRNPTYHSKWDLPNTLDYDRMTRVVHGLSMVILDLCNSHH